MQYPIQVTVVAKSTMPVETLVREDTLRETLLQMHFFLMQDATRRLQTHKRENEFYDEAPLPEVKLVSESHSVFVLAGVAVVTVLATFEEQ